MAPTKSKLSEAGLPPLIFGTATFSLQFNPDPLALGPTQIVQRAMAHGVRAFDTSPYYGPAETILGDALATVADKYPRQEYFVLTKVGRVSSNVFDYSPGWIRHSVTRSCQRLRTNYLDVVYCHDVEFVSAEEVLNAIRELRRIRDESGTIKHVGICGYPVDVLCELAELVVRETGEPLDIVQSYANFTVQNQRLQNQALTRLINAGVDIVTNASPLGMGLLRKQGPPIGTMGKWHPAPDGLREACASVSDWLTSQGEKLEVVAVRFALETWLREGARVGTRRSISASSPPSSPHSSHSTIANGEPTKKLQRLQRLQQKLGVSVVGVSCIDELDETVRVWTSVLDGLGKDNDDSVDLDSDHTAAPGTRTPSDGLSDHDWSLKRRQQIQFYAAHVRQLLGHWADFAWPSPDATFVRAKNDSSLITDQVSVYTETKDVHAASISTTIPAATAAVGIANRMQTPPPEADDELV
ncbi:hypothetical protein DV736_g4971, partial [Chaetothyriales sp. CBS 134916]